MKKYFVLLLLCLMFVSASAQNYKELFAKALNYEETDSLKQAELLYKQALKLEPSNIHNGMIFANIARIQRRTQRFEEALQSYDYAINILPLSIPILMDRASLSLEMGKLDKAYVDCCTILDVDKKNTKALLFRAYLQYCNRQYNESLMDYNRLLELEPNNISARIGLVTLYQQDKKYKNALELSNKLLIESPDDAELYILRAGVEKDMGYQDLSLVDLDKAIILAPKYANAFLLRGDILLAQKKKEMAKMDFEKALELGISRAELVDRLKACK